MGMVKELPWADRYNPTTLSDVRGQQSAILKITQYVDSFSRKKPNAALLHGPPGSGKTSSVYALAKERNLEVVEVNASDTRNKTALEGLLTSVVGQQSLFQSGKLILVDEIDGLSGRKDRGGVSALTKILSKSAFPIILTANDPWSKKFSGLRRKCMMIGFEAVSHTEIVAMLQQVAKSEGVEYQEDAIDRLARMSGGDMRAALQDLQMLAAGGDSVDAKSLKMLDSRSQTESIALALPKVFKTTDGNIAWQAFDNIHENLDDCSLWIEENLPSEYAGALDLHRGFEALSRADIFKGRIRKRQHWRFLVYIRALLTMGVALAKDEKYRGMVKYRKPMKILNIWKAKQINATRDAVCLRIAEETHTSTRMARLAYLPYLKHISRGKSGALLMGQLELSPEEISWLRGR